MNTQLASSVLMINPSGFRFNEQTAINNYYQKDLKILTQEEVEDKAFLEFLNLAGKIGNAGVSVIAISNQLTDMPDQVFPNNWISFHDDGTAVMYPMLAENRRQERRTEICELLYKIGYQLVMIHDYSYYEAKNKFLEGTGSMVLDRVNKIAYASLSERTNKDVLKKFCHTYQYKSILFSSFQQVGAELLPIYHTNVMMSICEDCVVICADAIKNTKERNKVLRSLEQSGREIIYITEQQKESFAGNMLQLRNKDGNRIMVMSEKAYLSLTPEQIKTIEKGSEIIYSPLDTIETYGGGSARCMIAEVFLPKRHIPEIEN